MGLANRKSDYQRKLKYSSTIKIGGPIRRFDSSQNCSQSTFHVSGHHDYSSLQIRPALETIEHSAWVRNERNSGSPSPFGIPLAFGFLLLRASPRQLERVGNPRKEKEIEPWRRKAGSVWTMSKLVFILYLLLSVQLLSCFANGKGKSKKRKKKSEAADLDSQGDAAENGRVDPAHVLHLQRKLLEVISSQNQSLLFAFPPNSTISASGAPKATSNVTSDPNFRQSSTGKKQFTDGVLPFDVDNTIIVVFQADRSVRIPDNYDWTEQVDDAGSPGWNGNSRLIYYWLDPSFVPGSDSGSNQHTCHFHLDDERSVDDEDQTVDGLQSDLLHWVLHSTTLLLSKSKASFIQGFFRETPSESGLPHTTAETPLKGHYNVKSLLARIILTRDTIPATSALEGSKQNSITHGLSVVTNRSTASARHTEQRIGSSYDEWQLIDNFLGTAAESSDRVWRTLRTLSFRCRTDHYCCQMYCCPEPGGFLGSFPYIIAFVWLTLLLALTAYTLRRYRSLLGTWCDRHILPSPLGASGPFPVAFIRALCFGTGKKSGQTREGGYTLLG